MNQFFIDSSNMAGDKIIITGDDVNHIRNVLKLRNGESVSLVNTSNNLTYYCSIEDQDRDSVSCLIEDVQSQSTELPADIIIYQGLPKADKLEFVIQKAVELGATKVVPVSMKRSIMKIEPKKMESKVNRWNGIAASAASQSKRGIIPEVSEVASYKLAIAEAMKTCDTVLIPYELAKGMDETRQIMEEIRRSVLDHNSISSEPSKKYSIGIFIGPEGGFDQTEIDLALELGAKVITLGKRILRTETAPLAILSWLTYLLEE